MGCSFNSSQTFIFPLLHPAPFRTLWDSSREWEKRKGQESSHLTKAVRNWPVVLRSAGCLRWTLSLAMVFRLFRDRQTHSAPSNPPSAGHLSPVVSFSEGDVLIMVGSFLLLGLRRLVPLAYLCSGLFGPLGHHLGENVRSLPLAPSHELSASSPKECVQATVQWPNTSILCSAIEAVSQISPCGGHNIP